MLPSKHRKPNEQQPDECLHSTSDCAHYRRCNQHIPHSATCAYQRLRNGVAAAGAAIGTITKFAVSSYSEYEQLAGGVETLFGAQGMSLNKYAEKVGQTVEQARGKYDQLIQAQTEVMNNAKVAYKTAGMSANDYMNTITSFAAALKQSTANETEAAKVANQTVIDMADNANKMGTNMEDIQNAYQGFSKQNYTMLD